jgi:hypothetical protein
MTYDNVLGDFAVGDEVVIGRRSLFEQRETSEGITLYAPPGLLAAMDGLRVTELLGEIVDVRHGSVFVKFDFNPSAISATFELWPAFPCRRPAGGLIADTDAAKG